MHHINDNRRGDGDEQPDVQVAIKDLVRGIGEILRGYQRNSLLMRKSARNRVLANYKALTETEMFRGVAPITLETRNMTDPVDPEIPNIRNGYNVTDKADGLRVLAFCDPKGELFSLKSKCTCNNSCYFALFVSGQCKFHSQLTSHQMSTKGEIQRT